MAKAPLIAKQRMRDGTGVVVLPGCPVPSSVGWSDEVRRNRIRQGFCEEPVKAKAKPKKAKRAKAAKE